MGRTEIPSAADEATSGAPGLSPRQPKRSHLTWRAIRWRLSSSVAFFLVAVTGVAAAAAGPIYLSAADNSIINTAIGNAAPQQTGITIDPYAGTAPSAVHLLAAASTVPGDSGGPGAQKQFGPPIVTTSLSAEFLIAGSTKHAPVLDEMDLVARPGACSSLHLVAGHCPRSSNEIAVSTRSAKALGIQLGSNLDAISPPRLRLPNRPPGATPPLVVSGLYTPGGLSQPEWWGNDYFTYGLPPPRGANFLQYLDDAFMTASGADFFGRYLSPSISVQLPLDKATVSSANASQVANAVGSWRNSAQQLYQVTVLTNLPQLLTGAVGQTNLARTVVLLVTLQLVLLALLVLFAVAKATSDARAADVRVAELRGLPRGGVIRLVMREPVVLLLAALPAGLLVAWLGVTALSAALLSGGVPNVDELAAVAAVGAFAAGIVASGLGSYGLIRSGFTQESVEIALKSRSRNAAMVDALGIALAAGACAELVATRNSGQSASTDPLAVAGPALLALGLGIIGSRLLPLAARSLIAATRRSSHVSLGLAVRSLGRRLALARRVTVPSIAAGLLVFSVAGLVVSQRNYSMQALFTVGATDVLQTQVKPGVDFLQAVRTADKGMAPAMAAASVTAPYGQTLAVDARQLTKVVQWPAGLSDASLASLANRLAPPTSPSVYVPPGNTIAITADLLTKVEPPVDMQVTLFNERTDDQFSLDLGNLHQGTHTYTGSISGFCPDRCRLDGFTLFWLPGSGKRVGGSDAAIRFDGVTSGGDATTAVAAGLSDQGRWKANGPVVLVPGPSGLTAYANLTTSTIPSIVPNDVPSPVPGVVTENFVTYNTNPLQPNIYQSVGLDQNQITVRGIDTVPILPGAGSTGVLMDLGVAQRLQTHPLAGASFQIWCKDQPTAAFLQRLSQQGITVTGSKTADSILKQLKKSGPSLGFDLFSLSAVGGLLLAAAALLFAITANARQRALELVGLSAAGLKRRPLGRSVLLESLMISLTGALFGFVAGVVGAALALPSLPEFGPGRAGPPLQLGLPWLDVILSGVAIVVVLVLTSVVAGSLVTRWITPNQLRMQA